MAASPRLAVLLGPSLALALACGDDGRATSQGSATGVSTANPSTGVPPDTDTGSATSTGASTGGEASTSTGVPTTTGDTGTGASTGMVTATEATTAVSTGGGSTGDTGETSGACLDALPMPAGPEAVLAQEYVGTYFAYDLGPVPKLGGGVLPRLGGLVISPKEPNLLYIVGPSEVPEAQLHQIFVERGPCGHIVGWAGEATPVLSAPYLDLMANGPKGVVFLSHYPTKKLSQYLPGAMSLASTIDLTPLGQNQSPGGINFVPAGFPDAGMLRVMGFPIDHVGPGSWSRADITYNGDHYEIGALTKTVDVPYGPGGFSYIPAGSPLFPEQRIMVTEWLSNPRGVSSYAVDADGDPIVETRKPFFESFVKPWGSYFEPETGDYMFLQWENQPDHVFIVQGFVPPPPIPG